MPRGQQLAKQPSVNPQRIGAVGYCFGGAVVLNMARAGADLAAVAGFHASLGLNTPAPAPGTVKAKVLVLNGADDPFVKREQYEALKKDLDAAKADYRVIEYPGAVHAFTNPEATELGKKFNLPLGTTPRPNKEAKARRPSSSPPHSRSETKWGWGAFVIQRTLPGPCGRGRFAQLTNPLMSPHDSAGTFSRAWPLQNRGRMRARPAPQAPYQFPMPRRRRTGRRSDWTR